ncbi:cell wall mannoprotein 1 family protein [Aspergillus alliaceus]|uniref:cell wall mannoprotein 1 family protein n=1 Tax=Petromyces alliaceus TaxID=209559 RepID=UPI0012A715BB|nr:uncharacterized protein BDW43DRAFT_305987 [Aspergillus alliaceus]KAB8239104.1 hypothetical protein BDW43DRAFT_305987 [Aspergillus alliaceus]
MHLPILTALLILLPLTTSNPIPLDLSPLTTDATPILNDLTKLTTDLSTLTTAIKSYTGGLIPALDIQRKEMIVERDLEQATSDTEAATPFTVDESAAATRALLGLEPDVREALGGLISKKPLVNQAGVGAVVRMDLVNLKSKTGLLSSALQGKATEMDRTTLASKTTELIAGFDDAIRAYS